MATQRITIAKVGGAAAETILDQLRVWSAARRAINPDQWSPDQWPLDVKRRAGCLVRQLRAHAHELPVIYFAEWMDMWSMGDLFVSPWAAEFRNGGWLSPPGGPPPFEVAADDCVVFGYIACPTAATSPGTWRAPGRSNSPNQLGSCEGSAWQ